MLWAVLNKYWKQYPTKQQLYGHLPHISQTIQVIQARHARHSWIRWDELISNILQWTPTHGHTNVGTPAMTYISSVQTRDVNKRNYQERWIIGMDGGKESRERTVGTT